jgi:hypothetical protein
MTILEKTALSAIVKHFEQNQAWFSYISSKFLTELEPGL